MQSVNDSAAHRVLYLPELLSLIVEECAADSDKHSQLTVAALAATCRYFCSIARPVLWRTVRSLGALMRVVAPDAFVPSSLHEGYLGISRPLRQEDAKTLDEVRFYIKTLILSDNEPSIGRFDRHARGAVLSFYKRPLMPNVEAIKIDSDSMITAAYILVTPKTQVIEVTLPQSLQDSWDAHRQERDLDYSRYFRKLFKATSSECLHLRSFVVDCYNIRRVSTSRLQLFTDQYCKFLARAPMSLTMIEAPIPITTDAACHLLQKHLDTCRLNLEIAHVPTLVDALSSAQGTVSPWLRLTTLILDFETLTDDVTTLVSMLRVPIIEHLQISTRLSHGATARRVYTLCRAIRRMCNVDTLNGLVIHLSQEKSNSRSATDSDPEGQLRLDDIKPLLGFKQLRVFYLVTPHLIVNNDLVAEVAHAFPSLKALGLLGREYMGFIHCTTTLEALKILNERCPNLRSLELAIDLTLGSGSRHGLRIFNGGVPNPNLHTLHLRSSTFAPLGSCCSSRRCVSYAHFLGWSMRQMLPNVTTMTIGYGEASTSRTAAFEAMKNAFDKDTLDPAISLE